MNPNIKKILEKAVDESQHYCSTPIDINHENVIFLTEVLTEYLINQCCLDIKHKSSELLDIDFADAYIALLKKTYLKK